MTERRVRFSQYSLWRRILAMMLIAFCLIIGPVLLYTFTRQMIRDIRVHDTEFLSTLFEWTIVLIFATTIAVRGSRRIKIIKNFLWFDAAILGLWLCLYIGGFRGGGDPCLVHPELHAMQDHPEKISAQQQSAIDSVERSLRH